MGVLTAVAAALTMGLRGRCASQVQFGAPMQDRSHLQTSNHKCSHHIARVMVAQDRGVASPSTSGSRGGEHATPFRDQRSHFPIPGHGEFWQSSTSGLLSPHLTAQGLWSCFLQPVDSFTDQCSPSCTGLSPAHSRSLTSGMSEGRSLTPAQSAGFTGRVLRLELI